MGRDSPDDNALVALLPESFDVEHFLAEYWQKKPLLIRGNGHFIDPLDPDEIAGMACEEFIESRLIRSDPLRERWTLRNGPFPEAELRTLPESHWSLLIQAADQWDEGARAILAAFDFIPRWRIDDLMISLASDGGGVGPHFDYYDVFLIQGLGKKRWRLGGHVDSDSPLRSDTELKLLSEFEAQEDWIVEPGDILYIPPNWAHYGLAIGTSITYSVGFRTPSVAELIDDVSNELIESLREDERYVDTSPKRPNRVGEISPAVNEQVLALLQQRLLDTALVSRSFGKYMTQAKYPDLIETPAPLTAAALGALLDAGATLQRHPIARFAFTQHGDGSTELFFGGHSLTSPASFDATLEALCDPFAPEPDWVTVFHADQRNANTLVALYNLGSLWVGDDTDEGDEAE